MTTFGELNIGDMFNTKPARYVKTTSMDAIVVMSGTFAIGEIQEISKDLEVIVLYSNICA